MPSVWRKSVLALAIAAAWTRLEMPAVWGDRDG
jgi:hypothetical protein